MEDFVDAPYFTLAERDRRWGRLRELMRAAGCDCLLAPQFDAPHDETAARYLAQIGGGDFGTTVVFPGEGEPTAFLTREIAGEAAARARTWVTDLRFHARPETVADRLCELGLQKARLAIAADEGVAGDELDSWVVGLRRALPEATIAPDSRLVREAAL